MVVKMFIVLVGLLPFGAFAQSVVAKKQASSVEGENMTGYQVSFGAAEGEVRVRADERVARPPAEEQRAVQLRRERLVRVEGRAGDDQPSLRHRLHQRPVEADLVASLAHDLPPEAWRRGSRARLSTATTPRASRVASA